ncbi:FeS cluster assembly protein SufB [Spirochaetota bacterium]|nr:FeS cluster assembly protein SufB [Spirochaetota bacterium]
MPHQEVSTLETLPEDKREAQKIASQEYQAGFTTDIATDTLEKGLNEAVITEISRKKNEPKFILNFRLKAYQSWKHMQEPAWARVTYPAINFQDISYYSSPKSITGTSAPKKIEDVDEEILKTFERLGIPLSEQKRLAGVAVDAVFDSVSLGTTHQEKLEKMGIVFCSFSEATEKYPMLIKKYLGTVVPHTDNFYAALNSAVFSDGSFCYIPKGVKCPIDLSTYFRINAMETGQFERTLLIADEGSSVNYLEGCTAPIRDKNQLHAAVVELVALEGATINYSTVQNWYSGDAEGKGGIYNFVTKRGICKGNHAKISWTQVEAGSAITWKYPSVILKGDHSIGEFYSVALTNNKMQADTGTKMIHVGKNTRSKIISKGISADNSQNVYRGLVKIGPTATHAKNFTQCDSLLVYDKCAAHTFPLIEVKNNSSTVEHEATTSKISDDQLFYLQTRGINKELAISLLINGFCKDVFNKLPLEFSVEAVRLLEMKLENSVG